MKLPDPLSWAARRVFAFLVLPIDRAIFTARFLTGIPRLMAGPGETTAGPTAEAGGRAVRIDWGSGPRGRWPPLRIELPPGAESVSSTTALGTRQTVWSTAGTVDGAVEFFRSRFDEAGVAHQEIPRRHYRILHPAAPWDDVELRIARYEDSPVMINIRQFLYRRPGRRSRG